jgi:hypothetical protein
MVSRVCWLHSSRLLSHVAFYLKVTRSGVTDIADRRLRPTWHGLGNFRKSPLGSTNEALCWRNAMFNRLDNGWYLITAASPWIIESFVSLLLFSNLRHAIKLNHQQRTWLSRLLFKVEFANTVNDLD